MTKLYSFSCAALIVCVILGVFAPCSATTNPEVSCTIPSQFPLYKQCNSKWADDLMTTKTVCQVGCLMSSCSMALNAHGVLLDGSVSPNPGSLNSWLRNNGGYDNDNDLKENVLEKLDHVTYIGPVFGGTSISEQELRQYISNNTVVIGNVMKGRHFVLLTGWASDGSSKFCINDPGFNLETYDYSDFVGYRLLSM